MNVEDIASKISVIFGIQQDWRDHISGVHVSPGSAETLARGDGIANHDLIAYSLSIISAKKLLNRLMCVEVIVWYIIVVFLRHSVYILKTDRVSTGRDFNRLPRLFPLKVLNRVSFDLVFLYVHESWSQLSWNWRSRYEVKVKLQKSRSKFESSSLRRSELDPPSSTVF